MDKDPVLSTEDLADTVVAEMRDGDITAPPPDDVMEPDGTIDADRAYIFANKIRFTARHDDQLILARIKAAADQEWQNNFAAVVPVLEHLYMSMRIPRTTATGEWVRDDRGRVVWQIDEATGRPKESLAQLTGQDIDQAILTLENLLLEVSPRITELRLEALYFQNTAKDQFDDAWPGTGTLNDRTTTANQASRIDRWHAYFRYYVYATSNAFYLELRSFVRRLDAIRYRSIRES